MAVIASANDPVDTHGMSLLPPGQISLYFKGSAGQGFGVFLTDGVSLILEGEANDSVGKGMSGGALVITPPKSVRYRPEANVIIGNCALYGATGGMLFVHGVAGDRFAVRNSGAVAVVEGAGLHLCEYMTHGVVVVLGEVSYNVGAGMTGGKIYLLDEYTDRLNGEFVSPVGLTEEDEHDLRRLLVAYGAAAGSERIVWMLSEWKILRNRFVVVIPNRRAMEKRDAHILEEMALEDPPRIIHETRLLGG
jgi:glutamate synthase domain-containing protein 3